MVSADARSEGTNDSVNSPEQGGPHGLAEAHMECFREKIRGADKKQLSEEVQAELGAVMALAARIQQSPSPATRDVAAEIGFIIDCLLADKPRLALAREERSRLRVALYSGRSLPLRIFAGVLAGNSIAVILIAPLVSLVLWAGLIWFIHWLYVKDVMDVAKQAFFMNSQALIAITSAAFVGGIVSIATRWREFAPVYDIDPAARFLNVMFKPLIGVAVSVVVLGMLESKMVTFSIFDNDAFAILDSRDFKAYYDDSRTGLPPDLTAERSARIQIGFHTLHLLWIFGFLSGFSERFAWDFVGRAESIASGKSKSTKRMTTNTD